MDFNPNLSFGTKIAKKTNAGKHSNSPHSGDGDVASAEALALLPLQMDVGNWTAWKAEGALSCGCHRLVWTRKRLWEDRIAAAQPLKSC
jgi:hypothetical protein